VRAAHGLVRVEGPAQAGALLADGAARREFTPHQEVDRIEWLDLDEAGERLTYDHDRDLLAAVMERL
jgi:hypothetical protein